MRPEALIRVKVKAGARKERVIEAGASAYDIDVKEPAEQNAANKRVVVLIARHFRVPEKSVRIVSGHRKQNKILRITN